MSSELSTGAGGADDAYRQCVAYVEGLAREENVEDCELLQRLTQATIKVFVKYVQAHGRAPLPADHELTATDVVTVCAQLLKATDLEVFELAMWQSWGGATAFPGSAPSDQESGKL